MEVFGEGIFDDGVHSLAEFPGYDPESDVYLVGTSVCVGVQVLLACPFLVDQAVNYFVVSGLKASAKATALPAEGLQVQKTMLASQPTTDSVQGLNVASTHLTDSYRIYKKQSLLSSRLDLNGWQMHGQHKAHVPAKTLHTDFVTVSVFSENQQLGFNVQVHPTILGVLTAVAVSYAVGVTWGTGVSASKVDEALKVARDLAKDVVQVLVSNQAKPSNNMRCASKDKHRRLRRS